MAYDTKNLVIALILSTAILFGWQYFYAEPKLKEAQKYQQAMKQKEAEKAAIVANNTSANTAAEENTPDVVLHDRKEIIKEAGRIKISNGKLHGSILLQGARFDDLTLAEYKLVDTPEGEEVVLLSPSGSKRVYFAEFGWVAGDNETIVPDSQTIWYSDDKTLTQEHPVTLSWDNNDGLKFFIDIALDENYMFQITRRVESYGSKSAAILPYGILNRTREHHDKNFYILHEGALGVLDGVLSEVRFDDLKKEKKQEFKNSRGWIGITDKYWLTALIPDKSNSFDVNYKYFYKNDQDRYQVDFLGNKQDIEPGKSLVTTDHFFAGAKKLSLLDNYVKTLDIELFDRAVDFGWLYFITKPIFKLLTYFHALLGNFGLAILMLTVVLKLLLFPLANKSYVSMHHLKRLQPQIVELKDRYKNDKVGMNKAVMELYREEKVNPMAGCLPLLIQIPVFFALYKVLFITIEMRHAPFYGWITDLSAPDPTSIFNLFGLLPFTPPHMLMIGVWPLIMCFTMWLQQKMNPQPADPVQAKVMKMLPFIFLFLFATFPAGLVIYWAWNNILSILQQWVITRRLPKS